jgi:hypothetical protein
VAYGANQRAGQPEKNKSVPQGHVSSARVVVPEGLYQYLSDFSLRNTAIGEYNIGLFNV